MLASIPSTFVAATKAKAAEVNSNFTEIFNSVNQGTHEIYANTFRNNRTSQESLTFTGSDCAFFGYHTIDSNASYHFATSTARGICFVELTVNTGGSLVLASGSEFAVVS